MIEAKMNVNNANFIEKFYKDHQNIKPKDIEDLLMWLNNQEHLPRSYLNDVDLVLAFHSCGWDNELTKHVFDLNFTLRTLFSFYQNRVCDEYLETALHVWLITPIGAVTKKGNRAIYCKLLDPDTSKFVYADIVKAFVMIVDLWQYSEGPIPGVAVIVDMDQVSMGHVTKIDLGVAQQFFFFLQEAMFIRLREFHFINAPGFIDSFLSMMRPFFKKEMLDMLMVHQADSTSLADHLPVNELPTGDICIEKRDYIWNKLKANKIFFEDESKKRVNENKRVGERKSISSYFTGVEESFKKLEID